MRSITIIVTFLATLFFTAHEAESLLVVQDLDPPPKSRKREINKKSNMLNPQQGRSGQDNLRLKKYSKLYKVVLPYICYSRGLDSSMGKVFVETRRCEFESRSRQIIFRCPLHCQNNMKLHDFSVSLRMFLK